MIYLAFLRGLRSRDRKQVSGESVVDIGRFVQPISLELPLALEKALVCL